MGATGDAYPDVRVALLVGVFLLQRLESLWLEKKRYVLIMKFAIQHKYNKKQKQKTKS